MRPIPESRHKIAAAILLLAAAASTYFAWADWRLGDEQFRALTALQKAQDPQLYGHDFVFGPAGVWRFESPAFHEALAALARLGGDELMPFRILTGLAVLVYLGGMYALLYSQTSSWSVSVFVSILSMTVIHTLGGGAWGVGSLASTTPAGIVTAFTPLLTLAMLHLQDKRKLPLVFAAIGLLASVHVPSAGNLTILLLLVYLAQRRFRPRACLMALACGAVAMACATPILVYRWFLADQLRPGGSTISATAVRHASKLAEWDALYPRLLEGVWSWLLLLVILLVISAVILARGERFGVRNFATWVWWILGAIVVTFGFQGAAQLWGLAWGKPAVVGYARASALVLLPLYVLLAQALTTLFRVAHGHRALARWGCAVFLAAWMAPADNFRAPRTALADLVTVFMKEEDKPRYVRGHHEQFTEWREMRNIALWARRESPPDAVFVCDSAELRFYSRRSALAIQDDVDLLYRHAPWNLAAWGKALDGQHKALDAGGSGPLQSLVAELAKPEEMQGVSQWYVVLHATDQAAGELPAIPPQGWGRSYVLCRLR
jgi:hypothetical protein